MATQAPAPTNDQDPTAARQCGGWPRVGIPAHPSTRDQFGRNAANPDGLSGACKACNTKYRQQRAGGVKAAKADPQAPKAPRAPRAPKPVVDDAPAIDGTAAQAAEHAALDAQLAAAGGVATDDGQALLAQAAADAARAKRDARNARQQAWRAARKAAAANS